MPYCTRCWKDIPLEEAMSPNFVHTCDPDDLAREWMRGMAFPIIMFLLGAAAGSFFTIALS